MQKKTQAVLKPTLIALAVSMMVASLGNAAAAAEEPAAPALDAAPAAAAAQDATASANVATVEISTRKTRSSVAMSGNEMQKVLPGVNPIKALATLPGVSFQTADPWGNNEQNLVLFVHGFSGQQLGYTMDGVPLGDQSYGNYNGLAPQRALTSENVARSVLSTGVGDLGTASTSNLGGTIETYSRDPSVQRNINLQETVGSYKATRTFVRYDSGEFGDGNRFYVSGLHHKAKAWDFEGKQGDDQVNGKFIHESQAGKLTLYVDWNDKTEPNEDSTLRSATQAYQPYIRPFLYPDFAGALAYLSANGAPPAAEGSNFRNYYSDAQRTDQLAYAKYDAYLGNNVTWSNQYYFHHNDGVGVVAGPINQAGLPGLFNVYFPNQNLKQVFGNSGYATRTTEYKINRQGFLSTVQADLGEHHLQAGLWYEHNDADAYRRWYALDVNNPSSPYTRPGTIAKPLITQYGSHIFNQVVQLHVQDEWRMRPDLTLLAGFKSSLQFADGSFPVQELPAAIGGGSKGLPEGKIDYKKWVLPQLGLRWDVDRTDQVFANVAQNLRQYMTYGAGGPSPWSLSSQPAFDYFKQTAKPETSVTYELGARTTRKLDGGVLSAFDGQVSLYHVDFHDRQLSVSSNPIINSYVGGTTILSNVGDVKTNGIDLAGTFHFGRDFSFYDALSYNTSTYQDSYYNGTTLVPTAGKQVPNSPQWMNKFIASLNAGGAEAQLIGEYVGKRYATYTNDLYVPGYFLTTLNVTGKVPVPASFLKNLSWTVSVTNLFDRKGVLQPNVGQASGSYATYPIPPRMAYVTLRTDF
ncbi:MAG: TonB-dependent receptor [Telluria sp.]